MVTSSYEPIHWRSPMGQPFSRTLRSLRRDDSRRSLTTLAIGCVVLGGWIVWFVTSRIAVYEVTSTARLEVGAAVHRVSSTASGRIVAIEVGLGQEVAAGDILVELDSESQRLELEQARTTLASLDPELAFLREEISAQQQRLVDAQASGRALLRETRASLREAEARTATAREELQRLETLREAGSASASEVARARSIVVERESGADALRHRVERIELEHREQRSGKKAGLEQLKRELAQLEGHAASARGAIGRLEHDLDARRIRAPVAGRVGELSEQRIGGVLAPGEMVVAIVPPGKLRVVADYDPADAVGRIDAGQAARLRLDGFPWAQYGSVAATVTNVATETRDGRIRVELAVIAPEAFGVPLRHGMTGALEIEVERVSPAALVLRASGKLMESEE